MTLTSRPMALILKVTEDYVLPYPAVVDQVLAVESALIICLLDERLVLGENTVVRKEWRDHIHRVGPENAATGIMLGSISKAA